MTSKPSRVVVEVPLEYRIGRDEPERGIFRSSVVPPQFTRELTIVIQEPARAVPELASDDELDLRMQVHLAGSPRALEELGRYLIALARLETADPEPYGMIEDVSNGGGGTVRLLPRRLSTSSI